MKIKIKEALVKISEQVIDNSDSRNVKAIPFNFRQLYILFPFPIFGLIIRSYDLFYYLLKSTTLKLIDNWEEGNVLSNNKS